MKGKNEIENNVSTEDKIKEAAKKVFTQKGYAATRTRDIAEAAGLNLALLNYYFRSKEKLFDIIMLETFQEFMQNVVSIINAPETTLQEKIELMVSRYIDTLTLHPDLPLFIITELKANPKKFMNKIGMKQVFADSYLRKQIDEIRAKNKTTLPYPVHHLMLNMMSLIVFPFVASPIIQNVGGIPSEQFNTLMQERKKLIPMWIGAMLQPAMVSQEIKEPKKEVNKKK